jgi:hypothetical protein
MKRSAGGSLTGGTGDVNPQWLKISVTQSGADTFTQSTNPVPVQRLPTSGRAQVMEILKLFFYSDAARAEVDSTLQAFLTTKSYSSAPGKTDGPLIAWWKEATEITTSGQVVVSYPFQMDLMDGAGHGVIVATDNIYLSAGSSTTSVANVVYCWILYRWKNVALPEYIGIVQSQQ